MILGVGIDVVDVARFGAALERTPSLRDRLFTPREREMALNSKAARFAAKEALAKVVRARLRERDATRVVALVGGGNNGADALYAVARLARGGFHAAAVLTGAGPVHAGARADAERSGVVLLDGSLVFDGAGEWADVLAEAEVVVDGITGIGGRPGLREEAQRWVAQIPQDAYASRSTCPAAPTQRGWSPPPRP